VQLQPVLPPVQRVPPQGVKPAAVHLQREQYEALKELHACYAQYVSRVQRMFQTRLEAMHAACNPVKSAAGAASAGVADADAHRVFRAAELAMHQRTWDTLMHSAQLHLADVHLAHTDRCADVKEAGALLKFLRDCVCDLQRHLYKVEMAFVTKVVKLGGAQLTKLKEAQAAAKLSIEACNDVLQLPQEATGFSSSFASRGAAARQAAFNTGSGELYGSDAPSSGRRTRRVTNRSLDAQYAMEGAQLLASSTKRSGKALFSAAEVLFETSGDVPSGAHLHVYATRSAADAAPVPDKHNGHVIRTFTKQFARMALRFRGHIPPTVSTVDCGGLPAALAQVRRALQGAGAAHGAGTTDSPSPREQSLDNSTDDESTCSGTPKAAAAGSVGGGADDDSEVGSDDEDSALAALEAEEREDAHALVEDSEEESDGSFIEEDDVSDSDSEGDGEHDSVGNTQGTDGDDEEGDIVLTPAVEVPEGDDSDEDIV